MARLWAMTVEFDNVTVGDTLPVLIKWETEDTILRYNSLHGEPDENDEYPDTLPQKTVESYVVELLGKGFPPEKLGAEGSRVDVEHLLAVAANDTISLSGAVTGKHTAQGLRLVECAVARWTTTAASRWPAPPPSSACRPYAFSLTTGLDSTPMPGISTSTRSPSLSATVTPVEPEKIRSPGCRVICWLM